MVQDPTTGILWVTHESHDRGHVDGCAIKEENAISPHIGLSIFISSKFSTEKRAGLDKSLLRIDQLTNVKITAAVRC